MQRLYRLQRSVRQAVCIFVFALAFAITANAYTVIMSGGRTVQVPSQFVVTAASLTYEVSPGVQVTLMMAAINIPATEKANNEPPGSLLRRAGLPERDAVSRAQAGEIRTAPPAAAARRTITNLDLESNALRRRQSELAYEERRKQLGLPSVEESRQQAAAEAEVIRASLEEQRLAENKTEDYWRERATALRTEMAAVDGEIAWTRTRLDEGVASSYAWNGWNGWSSGSFATVVGIAPFGGVRAGGARNFGGNVGGNFGGRRAFGTGGHARPSVYVAPNRGPQVGGATRGRVLPNPGFRPARPGAILGGLHSSGFANGAVFGSVPAFDYSYERSELITRFNELAGARAGLNARWRELEEEARRAGASPGWLRP